MPARPIQISINEDLLVRIDRDPLAKSKGRSALIRAAVELYLEARRKQAIDTKLERAFRSHADELARDVEVMLGAQVWPEK